MSNLQKILLSIKESFEREPYCVASAKVDAAVKAMDALDPIFHEKVCASIFVSEKETSNAE